MRKQVDLHVRTFPMGNGAAGETATYLQVSEFLRENYLSKGWEVLNTYPAQISAGTIFVMVALVKYEDVPEPVTGGSDGVDGVAEVKAKRPYHRRAEVEPA
jgi:hypothetical protein